MFDVKFIDEKTQWINLVKKVRELSDEEGNMVEVGLFKDPVLIQIAKENEFGDIPRRKRPWPIPERSFLRYVFDRDLKKNIKLLKDQLNLVLFYGKKRFLALEDIGKIVSGSIKEFILSGYYISIKPNHPITIRKKKHNYPLIESGKIVSELTYKVGKGNPSASSKTIIIK